MKKLHQQVKAIIDKVSEAFKAITYKNIQETLYDPRDLVWVHLKKERCPSRRKNKLMPRRDGPYKMLERINNNAYKIELPGDMGNISVTSNVGDSQPYIE